MNPSESAIRVRQLHFQYGDEFALHVDELDVEAGQRIACIGPSGCGKTTFLHLLAGILPAQSGELNVLGRNLPAMADAACRSFRIARIGLVFQEFELLEYLTAGENMLLPFQVNQALRLDSEVQSRVHHLASQLGIEALLQRRPAALSQGERQRVALGRALITRPDLVLCDEPTGNLDPAATADSLDLLFEQCATRNATLLVVTHDHQILPRFDRVIELGKPLSGAQR